MGTTDESNGGRPWGVWLAALLLAVVGNLLLRIVALAVFEIPPEFPPLSMAGPTIFLTDDRRHRCGGRLASRRTTIGQAGPAVSPGGRCGPDGVATNRMSGYLGVTQELFPSVLTLLGERRRDEQCDVSG